MLIQLQVSNSISFIIHTNIPSPAIERNNRPVEDLELTIATEQIVRQHAQMSPTRGAPSSVDPEMRMANESHMSRARAQLSSVSSCEEHQQIHTTTTTTTTTTTVQRSPSLLTSLPKAVNVLEGKPISFVLL